MPRIIPTALSAVTIVALGIASLHFKQQELAGESLSGQDATAYNLTREISTDLFGIMGNALPRLLMIVIIVLAIVMLLMTR